MSHTLVFLDESPHDRAHNNSQHQGHQGKRILMHSGY